MDAERRLDAWAKRMARTHRQIRCSGCGLWTIWVQKVARPSRRRRS
jgi:hypothetical protein